MPFKTSSNDSNAKLCFICCQSFRPEIEAAIAAEQWSDVLVSYIPVNCGHPPLDGKEALPLVPKECTHIVILGRACLHELDKIPGDWPSIEQLRLGECLELVAGKTLVSEIMARGGYMITPAWLDDWRGNLRRFGFDENNIAGYFRDSVRELVFLDTGVLKENASNFTELVKVVGLPSSRIALGIDFTRLFLTRLVMEWRLENERRQSRVRELDHARELGDHLSAMDFLGQLALLKDEQETIAAIEEMFRMLFAPEEMHYIRYDFGALQLDDSFPPELSRQIDALKSDWAWTESGTGFLLRIRWAGEQLGIVVADHFAFPAFRDRYLNLALSAASVCSLAIKNARTYGRIREAEEALRKSEHSLNMAQAIAHLGHWEWDIDAREMDWSAETYRILGYDNEGLVPDIDFFLQAVHPDDREKVTNCLDQAGNEKAGFDIEYRIVLSDGRIRIVHMLGEVITFGKSKQSKMIGTIREVTTNESMKVLGIIQDITDRKELEIKLAQEAHTDSLTGCANHRYFLNLARSELARVRRYGGEMSILMLDLDHFKAVNDKHGHQAGNLVLQKLVQVCKLTLREEDIIGRLGGEEFAILLPETGRGKALEVAERLRQEVAATEVSLEKKTPISFTTSIGVASVIKEDSDINMVLERADRALYLAKNTGRNRVVQESN